MVVYLDIGIGTYTLILVLVVIVPVQYDEWGNRLSRTLLNTQHLLDTGVGYLLPIVIVMVSQSTTLDQDCWCQHFNYNLDIAPLVVKTSHLCSAISPSSSSSPPITITITITVHQS